MIDLLRSVFVSTEFMPHGHCFYWRPGLVGLHVVSDALIGTAYLVIALTLWHLVRRIKLPFSPMIVAFGVFIGACGLTHYMEVVTLWVPDYWLSGAVKAVTATASVATGVYLVRARPVILEVTRSAQLAEERRVQIEEKNRELEQLYRRIKDLDEARSRFFANVSHELRTPLALLLGPIEKLLGAPLPEQTRHDLEVARRNGRVLLRHVDDLLQVARLEVGRLPVQWARFDLAALVRDGAESFAALARDRGVAVRVDAPASVPVEGDPGQLEQVVGNLLSNAFKFVPDGGHVACSVTAGDGWAVVSVDDDGPGIPPEVRQAVFERFRQGAGRAARGGAGLGLAIARELVELHGGAIEATDHPGGGARLRFRVPLRAPPGAEVAGAPDPIRPRTATSAADALRDERQAGLDDPRREVARSAPAAASHAGTVLVVEDHPEMRRLVAEALEAELHVVTATDGAEALQVARALHPDLVLTDVMMPRLGGERLLQELTADPALAGVPVIVLTARDDQELRLALLEAGAVDYVVKPFLAEELRARVRNAVAMKRSRDAISRELESRGEDLEAMALELARRKRQLEGSVETARLALDQAERASQVKSTFLGMVSHELRTPLTSLQLGIAVLRDPRSQALDDRQRSTLERMERSAARLLDMVEALLEYTRVEAGKVVIRPEEVDLAALASDVVDETLGHAQRKLLEMSLVPPPPLPPLRTDRRLLRMMLLNLVVNAVKYTDQGWVRISLGHGPAGHLIEVADSGRGIAAADQLRIFEPFRQLAAPGEAQGVGLGLSLVRGVADALGAKLSLESEPGRGSTFRLTVPAAPGAAGGPEEGRAGGPPPAS